MKDMTDEDSREVMANISLGIGKSKRMEEELEALYADVRMLRAVLETLRSEFYEYKRKQGRKY